MGKDIWAADRYNIYTGVKELVAELQRQYAGVQVQIYGSKGGCPTPPPPYATERDWISGLQIGIIYTLKSRRGWPSCSTSTRESRCGFSTPTRPHASTLSWDVQCVALCLYTLLCSADIQCFALLDQVLLGVDRVDYIKGIPHKLLAMESLLETHPQYVGKVSSAIARPLLGQGSAMGSAKARPFSTWLGHCLA